MVSGKAVHLVVLIHGLWGEPTLPRTCSALIPLFRLACSFGRCEAGTRDGMVRYEGFEEGDGDLRSIRGSYCDHRGGRRRFRGAGGGHRWGYDFAADLRRSRCLCEQSGLGGGDPSWGKGILLSGALPRWKSRLLGSRETGSELPSSALYAKTPPSLGLR